MPPTARAAREVYDYDPCDCSNGVNALACVNTSASCARVLGIEAARATLVNELRSVIEFTGNVMSPKHVNLLCDIMTRKGDIMLPPGLGWLSDRR